MPHAAAASQPTHVSRLSPGSAGQTPPSRAAGSHARDTTAPRRMQPPAPSAMAGCQPPPPHNTHQHTTVGRRAGGWDRQNSQRDTRVALSRAGWRGTQQHCAHHLHPAPTRSFPKKPADVLSSVTMHECICMYTAWACPCMSPSLVHQQLLPGCPHRTQSPGRSCLLRASSRTPPCPHPPYGQCHVPRHRSSMRV